MKKITHEFVKTIPNTLSNGVVYVSIDYTTVAHKCFCGCGNEVHTPLSPTDWKIIFDGKSVSLYPSIGNWNLKCKPHYWIENGEVYWSYKWSEQQIQKAQLQDRLNKDIYYGDATENSNLSSPSFLKKLKKFFAGE